MMQPGGGSGSSPTRRAGRLSLSARRSSSFGAPAPTARPRRNTQRPKMSVSHAHAHTAPPTSPTRLAAACAAGVTSALDTAAAADRAAETSCGGDAAAGAGAARDARAGANVHPTRLDNAAEEDDDDDDTPCFRLLPAPGLAARTQAARQLQQQQQRVSSPGSLGSLQRPAPQPPSASARSPAVRRTGGGGDVTATRRRSAAPAAEAWARDWGAGRDWDEDDGWEAWEQWPPGAAAGGGRAVSARPAAAAARTSPAPTAPRTSPTAQRRPRGRASLPFAPSDSGGDGDGAAATVLRRAAPLCAITAHALPLRSCACADRPFPFGGGNAGPNARDNGVGPQRSAAATAKGSTASWARFSRARAAAETAVRRLW